MLTVASFRPWFFDRVVSKHTLQTLAALLVMTTATMLHAQAAPASEKTSEISAFFLFSRLCPDYGPTNNNGFTVGGDYTFRNRIRWFDPSLEFRVRSATGTTVDEKFLGGGIKVEKVIRNFRPYGNILVGRGSITYKFKPGNTLPNGTALTSDSSLSFAAGGGLDYYIAKGFSVRGEYQTEWWKSMSDTVRVPTDLTPYSWSFGVAYRIPFRPFTRQ